MLDRIHTGHQGITKCRERARQSIWWPGLSKQLEEMVKCCTECCKTQTQRFEPLIPSCLPELPWQKIGTDLFEWNQNTYLLIVDYYSHFIEISRLNRTTADEVIVHTKSIFARHGISRFIEISRLNRTTADEVIVHTKSIFARHGIPEIVVPDNGSQYASEAFAKFAHEYQFEHVTSSPYHPQSNGEAEHPVQTVKRLLKKEGDPYLAMLSYRATPLYCGYSPSELLMARKIRTNIPMTLEQLKPKVPDQSSLRERDEQL